MKSNSTISYNYIYIFYEFYYEDTMNVTVALFNWIGRADLNKLKKLSINGLWIHSNDTDVAYLPLKKRTMCGIVISMYYYKITSLTWFNSKTHFCLSLHYFPAWSFKKKKKAPMSVRIDLKMVRTLLTSYKYLEGLGITRE